MRIIVGAVLLLSCKPTPFSYLSPPGGSDSRTGVGSLGIQVANALDAEYRGQVSRKPEAPVKLTPSDGTELALTAIDASVTIRGPLAHTELKFAFKNSEDRVREGRFAIDLPAGAAVGRFAMRVGPELREARIVARDRAREVYETYLHRKVDPALLEQDLGNRFSARVFPIFARDEKEIIIGYDHVVSEGDPYTLALAGLPTVPRLQITIDRDGTISRDDRSGREPEDLVIPIRAGDAAVATSEAFVVRVATDEHSTPAPLERVLVLVDTSASRAPVMGKQVELVRRVLGELPNETPVTISAFDHDVTELYRGPAREAGTGTLKLYEHGALGGSDLGAALERAAASGASRLVIVGDGMTTLGETDAKKLAATIAQSAITRVDAVQVGAAIDRDKLQALVTAGKQPGAILDGRDPLRVARQLKTAIAGELAITVEGATDVWPSTTRGVLPGEPVYVSGLRTTPGPIAVKLGDRAVSLAPIIGSMRNTRRAVARAELAHLTEQVHAAPAGVDRSALEKRIETVALEHELVSSRTSLLVLESDADEDLMLGPRTRPTTSQSQTAFRGTTEARDFVEGMGIGKGESQGRGELIQIRDTAPTIDPTSTQQGITIDSSYTRNIPVGRTFESAIGAAAGAQSDKLGVSFSGSSSLENVYYVDGINTTAIGSAGRRAQRSLAIVHHRGMLPFPAPTPTWSGPDRETSNLTRGESPYEGPMNDVMMALRQSRRDYALEKAARWQLGNPGDIAAIMSLGEAAEARGASAVAARAYGSIADLYPNRAELLRAAGERLDRVGARALAIDVYRRAVRERADQATGHRLLAWALFRVGRADEAYDTLRNALVSARSGAADLVIRNDLRLIAAHLVARDPARRKDLERHIGAPIPTKPALHIVLTWETDANDVDLHVWDRKNRHAFHAEPELASGGKLQFDHTDGYGPELFLIEDPHAFPYTIAAHYYSRGPMGIGLGTVQAIRHDGNGNITIEDRPFLIQKDKATVELGVVR